LSVREVARGQLIEGATFSVSNLVRHRVTNGALLPDENRRAMIGKVDIDSQQ